MKLLTVVITTLLTGCVSMPNLETQETRFQTKVALSEFNSVAGHYISKPTFASLITYPNGESPELLTYSADGYGANYNRYVGVTKNMLGLHIQRTTADAFASAIDKFLRWAETATVNKEAFTKDITEIEHDAVKISGFKSYFKLTFHSGNELDHYLLVKSCSFSNIVKEVCAGDTALDRNSVIELKNEINKFISGEIKQKDTASKYN